MFVLYLHIIFVIVEKKMSEEKKKYFQMRNKWTIPIRFNPQEMALLQTAMEEDDWTNVSGYIKYKLFGLSYEKRINEIVASNDSKAIGRLLLNCSLEHANTIEYLVYRYNRDMDRLRNEKGSDWKEWAKVTKRWHRNMLMKTEETLTMLRQVCEVLNIREYFEKPSDLIEIDPDTATAEEMDALAAQLQKERIAMGHIDINDK